MKRRPLAVVACSWIIGNGLAYLNDGTAFWLWWSGLTLFCPLLGNLLSAPWRKVVVVWIIFTLGAAYWTYNDSRNSSLISRTVLAGSEISSEIGEIVEIVESEVGLEGLNMNIRGEIISTVQIDGDRVDFVVQIQTATRLHQLAEANSKLIDTGQEIQAGGEKISVQIKLASLEELDEALTWRRGETTEFSGSLERPGTPTNFGGFNYRSYLRNQHIHWIMKVSGAGNIQILETGDEWGSLSTFFGTIDRMRNHLAVMIEQLFPDWQGGYMKGLLIGLDDDLEHEKYEQFTRLGLSHILAISGSHVAINVGLLFALLRLCRVSKETSILIALCCVPAYVLITGFSPSVIRSGMMTMLGLYLIRRGLLKDGMNVLSAVALLMLLWEPYLLLNVSFQLSFSVTAGLILFVPLLMPYVQWLPERMRSGVAITIAAQFVSFPLTIYYFNQFSLLSLAANMLIVPIIGLIVLPLGTAALLIGGAWITLGQWIAYPVRVLNSVTFELTQWLDGHRQFMTYWKSPNLLWMALYYIIFYLLLTHLAKDARVDRMGLINTNMMNDETAPLPGRRPPQEQRLQGYRSFRYHYSAWKGPLITLTLLSIFVGLVVIGYQPLNEKGIGHVQFIDVGQGDCVLITTPTGKNILVDGGGTVTFRRNEESWRTRKVPFEVGAKTVVPLLKKRGIHRIHTVIATHGDQDHIGGLQAVLEQFPVDSLLINGSLADTETMTKLMKTAISKKVSIYAPYQGMELQLDSTTQLQFISPLTPLASDGVPVIKEQNHWSIVFRLIMENTSFLFTGDMDVSAEKNVIANEGKVRDRRVDVLKVAHHGSKSSTSNEWIKYWNPSTYVISVGANNFYGHPHSDVLQRMEQAGGEIYRTDMHGEVQMKMKKGAIQVRCKSGDH